MDTDQHFSICTSISAVSLLKKYSLNSLPLLKKLEREYQDFSFDLKGIQNNSSIYLLSKIKKQFDCYELLIVEFNQHCEVLEIGDLGKFFMKMFVQIMTIVKNILEIIMPRLEKLNLQGNETRRNTYSAQTGCQKLSKFCKFQRFSNVQENGFKNGEYFAKKEKNNYFVKSLENQINEAENRFDIEFNRKLDKQLKENKEIFKIQPSLANRFIDETVSLFNSKGKSLLSFIQAQNNLIAQNPNKTKKNMEEVLLQFQTANKTKIDNAKQKIKSIFQTFRVLKQKQRQESMISQGIQTETPRKQKQISESQKISQKQKILKNEIKTLNTQIKNLEQKNEQITKIMNQRSEQYENKLFECQTNIFILKKKSGEQKYQNELLSSQIKSLQTKNLKSEQNLRGSNTSCFKNQLHLRDSNQSKDKDDEIKEESKSEQDSDEFNAMQLKIEKTTKQRNKVVKYRRPFIRQEKQNRWEDKQAKQQVEKIQAKKKLKRESDLVRFNHIPDPPNQCLTVRCSFKSSQNISKTQIGIQAEQSLEKIVLENMSVKGRASIVISSDSVIDNDSSIPNVQIKSVKIHRKSLVLISGNVGISIEAVKQPKLINQPIEEQDENKFGFSDLDINTVSHRNLLQKNFRKKENRTKNFDCELSICAYQMEDANKQNREVFISRSNSYQFSRQKFRKPKKQLSALLYVGSKQFQKNSINLKYEKQVPEIDQLKFSLKMPKFVQFCHEDLNSLFFSPEQAYQFEISSFTLGAYKKSRDSLKQGKKSSILLKNKYSQFYSQHSKVDPIKSVISDELSKIILKQMCALKPKKNKSQYEKIRNFMRFPYFTVKQAHGGQEKEVVHYKYRYMTKQKWLKLVKNEDDITLYDIKKFLMQLHRLHTKCEPSQSLTILNKKFICSHITDFLRKIGIFLKSS